MFKHEEEIYQGDDERIQINNLRWKEYKRQLYAIRRLLKSKKSLKDISRDEQIPYEKVVQHACNIDYHVKTVKWIDLEHSNPIHLKNWNLITKCNRYEYVYAIKCPITGKYVYVGKSRNPMTRIQVHLSIREKRDCRNILQHWARRNKHLKRMATILERARPINILKSEKKWINHFLKRGHPLLNKSLIK